MEFFDTDGLGLIGEDVYKRGSKRYEEGYSVARICETKPSKGGKVTGTQPEHYHPQRYPFVRISRVISRGSERKSIPFFYEPRADAEIRPLPTEPAEAFEPFYYGDYLWATTTQFVEFKGMEPLRKPLRAR